MSCRTANNELARCDDGTCRANRRGRIILKTCFDSKTPALIPHFINHYRAIGVEEFIAILHSETDDNPKRVESLAAMRSSGVEPLQNWIGEFLGGERTRRLDRLAMGRVRPEDWFLH